LSIKILKIQDVGMSDIFESKIDMLFRAIEDLSTWTQGIESLITRLNNNQSPSYPSQSSLVKAMPKSQL